MSNGHPIGTTYAEGLRTPRYVNGRLLSAEDLRADQEAVLTRLAALGRGAGHGIVEGLWVEQGRDRRTVRIQPGLGINREGDVIRLTGDAVTLAVDVQAPDDGPQATARTQGGRFHECATALADESTVTEQGAYLVTVRPVSRLEGQVPIQSAGRTAECAHKWAVEGLQFRIIRLENFPSADETWQKTRNRLAHWCYGSQNLRRLIRYPFTFPAAYNGLDQLGDDVLTPCDLPLALFYWSANGIQFVDNWSARRRRIQPHPGSRWNALLGDKRQAEGEARFLQFQRQLRGITDGNNARASDLFAYLPPVGFLPIRPSSWLREQLAGKLARELDMSQEIVAQRISAALPEDDSSLWRGTFDLDTFFNPEDDIQTRIFLADRYPIEKRLNQSWFEQPIDLADQPRLEIYVFYEELTQWIAAGGSSSNVSWLDAATANAFLEAISATGESESAGGSGAGFALDTLIGATGLPALDLSALMPLYNRVRIYAMFVQAEAELTATPIEQPDEEG